MMKMRGIFCCVVIVLEYFNVSPWQWQAVAANNMRNLLCYLPRRFIYSRFNLDTTGCMGIFCTVGSSYTKKRPRKMRKTHFYQLLEQLRQYECNKTQINTVCVTAGSKTNGKKWRTGCSVWLQPPWVWRLITHETPHNGAIEQKGCACMWTHCTDGWHHIVLLQNLSNAQLIN